MQKKPALTDRRAFILRSAQIGAGTALAGVTLGAAPAAGRAESTQLPPSGDASGTAAQPLISVPALPSRVFVQHDSGQYETMDRAGVRFSSEKASVRFEERSTGTGIFITSPKAALSRVIARWEVRFPVDALFVGDAWERSYGDLQWRYLQPERIMPWYFAAHQRTSGRSFMLGVKTQPSALCSWMVDGEGISLWLDLRNGGSPCWPGDREITVAEVISLHSREDETPFSALRRFCKALCPNPRLPSTPVCGNNNWYYAYGENFDAQAMRRDAAFLAELADGHHNAPYCVIDAGWSPGGVCPGGPWTQGNPKTFPDMPGLAADMRKMGVRAGVWMRPTALSTVDNPHRLRPGPIDVPEKPLDLTLSENLALIREDIARVRSWGYDLIKHDFSTFDLFARWGKDMGAEMTNAGWHFHDQTLTNAEIILRLYRALREGAGDAVLLGCNTMGHLGAGLFEVQRTGDDTSGRAWERTRRMGVNTLAYRLAQHGAFFSCDPDCAAHTERTPWELDRQFLDMVARSGTTLFVSADPRKVTAEQKRSFKAALQLALSGGETTRGCEPLDWLYNTTPESWRFGSEHVRYGWSEPFGTSSLPV